MSEQDSRQEQPEEALSAEQEAQGGADTRPQLKPEDRARVDAFLARGVNSVERKPFKPILLLIMLVVVVAGLSLLSQLLA